jgi:arylsulfatase A-like enzyme
MPAPKFFFGLPVLVSASAGALVAQQPSSPPQRPNIVIIVADDLGYADTSFSGSKDIRTPNLQHLAQTGVRLDRFYACPICSPTRAGLMTGRWPIRYGLMRAVIPPWSKFGLPETEKTMPELLAAAGYEHRAAVGKWHLGHGRRDFLPSRRGFASFYGHYNGAIDYFTHEREKQTDWHRDTPENARAIKESGYSTDLLAADAVRFIKNSPAGKPFLLYTAFNAPHAPLQAKPGDLSRYGHLQGKRRAYAAMVDCLDQAVGQILAAVEKRPDADNTLILFLSDNGGVLPYSRNTPYREGKFTVYEGGIRVCAAIRWPAAGLSGGRASDAHLGYIDVLPTLLSAAGAPPPSGANALDGINMLPILRDSTPPPARVWYSYIGQSEGKSAASVIEEDWKLIARGDDILSSKPGPKTRYELYNLAKDPSEKNNLAAAHHDRVKRLRARLVGFGRLQPEGKGVSHYSDGRDGFTAPKNWLIFDN